MLYFGIGNGRSRLVAVTVILSVGCASGASGGGTGTGSWPPGGGGGSGGDGFVSGSSGTSGGSGDAGALPEATATCQNPCAANSTICTPQGLIRTCVQSPTGCWHLSDPASCSAGEVCSGTTCVKACKDDCNEGGAKCDQGQAVSCSKGFDGCWHWGPHVVCSGGKVCKAGNCTACTSHADCDGQSVCRTGLCTAASGLTYEFTFVSGTMPLKDENGSAWDPAGDPGDPYVRLYINDKVACTTSTKWDTLTPAWNEVCATVVKTSDEIVFWVMDADAFSDDQMDGVKFSDTLSMLKSGGDSGPLHSTSAISLTWTVAPK